MQDKIFSSVSSNNEKRIREALEDMGRVKKSDVKAVQDQLVAIAKELINKPEGDPEKIILVSENEDYYE